MNSEKKSQGATIAALSFVLVVDALVMGIVFPVMGALFFQSSSAIVPETTSVMLRNIWYSTAMGIFFVCAIVGAPFVGDLSDIWGRRKVLLLSLFLNGISCLLSAIAVNEHWPFALVLSRALAGFASGNPPLAQAAIIDISTPQTKTRNLSLIALASSVGFIVGPLLGGVLSNAHLGHIFTYATPFQCAAILAFLNALYLLWVFQETFHPPKVRRIQLIKGLTLLFEGFRHKKVRVWVWVSLIEQLAWGIYFQSVMLVLLHVYHYTTAQVGIFIAVLSAAFAVALAFVVPWCVKYFKTVYLLFIGLSFLTATMIIGAGYIYSLKVIWISAMFFALGQACIFTSCMTLISNAVSANAQGWAMGVNNAVGALAWGISAFIVEGLLHVTLRLPFSAAAILFLFSMAVVWLHRLDAPNSPQ